jgi:hypothetical protein
MSFHVAPIASRATAGAIVPPTSPGSPGRRKISADSRLGKPGQNEGDREAGRRGIGPNSGRGPARAASGPPAISTQAITTPARMAARAEAGRHLRQRGTHDRRVEHLHEDRDRARPEQRVARSRSVHRPMIPS